MLVITACKHIRQSRAVILASNRLVTQLSVCDRKACFYTFKTMITESPRKNSLEMKRSFDAVLMTLPLLFFVVSVHNSLTSSRIKLQCLSKALILPITL